MPEVAGRLRRAQAEAHPWRADISKALERGLEAVERIERGSTEWFSAVTQVVFASYKLGRFDDAERWMSVVASTAAMADAESVKLICLADGAAVLSMVGRYAGGRALLDIVERAYASTDALDVEAAAHLHEARAAHAVCTGDLAAGADGMEAASRAYDQAGDRRNACSTRVNSGSILESFGTLEEGESLVRLTVAETLAASGRRDEAMAAIASARAALLARADKLSDPTWRERFLRDVSDNARTLDLARQRLGG
ncbi:hypothetical protein [Sorangium sp. So ce834]|uniref:hypothetical protein n=1 Tax=Sorangium sp. So ce834 TaxID=3133321 RepID=UPI003F63FEE7